MQGSEITLVPELLLALTFMLLPTHGRRLFIASLYSGCVLTHRFWHGPEVARQPLRALYSCGFRGPVFEPFCTGWFAAAEDFSCDRMPKPGQHRTGRGEHRASSGQVQAAWPLSRRSDPYTRARSHSHAGRSLHGHKTSKQSTVPFLEFLGDRYSSKLFLSPVPVRTKCK
jgi:hypothetical protein